MAEHHEFSYAATDPMLAFLEAMPDGMVVSDTKGRIVLVNGLLEKLSGYSADELLNREVEILVPRRYQTRHRTHRGGYYDSGHPPREMGGGLEIFLQRKDGEEIPVDIALSTIRLGGRRLILSAVRDATERKRAEAAIRENERRWRTLLESVRLMVVGLDLEGRINYTNSFLRNVLLYEDDELVGEDWFSLCLPQEASSQALHLFNELLRSESPAHHVDALRTRAGHQRVIAWNNAVLRDLQGNPVGTLSIGEDITDRKLAEDRLAAVNEVTRAILENRAAEDVVRVIARRSRTLAHASVATIVTPEAGGDLLVVQVAEGQHAPDLEGQVFTRAGSISEEVMHSRETLFLSDASADARVTQPGVRAASIGPALFAPLAVGDRAFGTLLVGRPRGAPPFSKGERAVIELFASQAAIALEHARFQDELHRLAVIEDRDRIGRELHDGAIQILFATGMRLHSALAFVDGEAAERIVQAVDDIDQVIGELRSYIFGLRPGVARRREVAEALRRLGEQLQETPGVVTVVDINPHAAAGIELTAELLQLVREALSNVGRHAHATTCRLFVGQVGDTIHIEIDDDGDGFHLSRRIGAGQGLPNLSRTRHRTGRHAGDRHHAGQGHDRSSLHPIDAIATALHIILGGRVA